MARIAWASSNVTVVAIANFARLLLKLAAVNVIQHLLFSLPSYLHHTGRPSQTVTKSVTGDSFQHAPDGGLSARRFAGFSAR